MDKIRNFCIIAHIDHGKSTLADRLMEITGTVEKRNMKAQLLDKMDLEREKGITIKLAPVHMQYKGHHLNLIDTPGHVDFSYEVSRSLAAVEGALLIVDASQGIQAQTLANVYLALEHDLEIIPVMNKIDLPAAEPDRIAEEIIGLLGCKREDIIEISAKTGKNVEQVLDAVIRLIPSPKGDVSKPLRGLVFDSFYDEYRGVILYVRIFDGRLKNRQDLKMMATSAEGEALELGTLQPIEEPHEALESGEIGYIVTNLKTVAQAKVGDTVTTLENGAEEILHGYKNVQPFVYAGLYPADADSYPVLKDALDKLSLSDSALIWTLESSEILGNGFRVGFLGLLHMEIVKERLEREHNLDLIITNPSTDYKVLTTTAEVIELKRASELPDPTQIESISEPWIEGEIVVPKEYLGQVLQLVSGSRGQQKNLSYLDESVALVRFEAPLANTLTDFYDRMKSATSGYASYSYDISGYREEDLVKLDLLVAGDVVDSLSQMVHRSEAQGKGRDYVTRMKEVIPRQQFEVSLQAAIGGKIIAREDVKALGKNVTAKLYGGDVSRKKKLWAKQKRGKARMKKFGKVDIPPEAFSALLSREE